MPRTISQALWILLVAGILAAASAWLHPRAPAWYLVVETGRWDLPIDRISEILGESSENIFWVDARPEAEFLKSHVSGATLFNQEISKDPDRLFEIQDLFLAARTAGRPVVVYCDGRGCEKSKEIAEDLRQSWGLEPVYVLRGDWRRLK